MMWSQLWVTMTFQTWQRPGHHLPSLGGGRPSDPLSDPSGFDALILGPLHGAGCDSQARPWPGRACAEDEQVGSFLW